MTKTILSFVFLAILIGAAFADDIAATSDHGYYYYKPSKVGGVCGSSRFCRKKLVCESHACKLKIGSPCKKAPSFCQSGSTCTILGGSKKCVVLLGLGDKCGFKTFSICKAGLVCLGNKCVYPKIPLGGSCKANGSVCEDGLVCAGTRRYKTCVKVRGPGMKCKTNPFFVCAPGLVCLDGLCKTPEGGSCLPDGSICVPGTKCIGRPTKKRCVVPRPVGGECGTNIFRICKKGLLCINYVCKEPKIPEGGSCIKPGSICEDGLVCAATTRYKSCVRVRGPGQFCKINPFFVCKPGLVCSGNKCKTPEGGDCLPEGSVCVSGTKCIGRPSKKKCIAPSPLGGRCGTFFSFCKGGLICDGHICKEPKIPEGGSCKAPGSVCEDGLTCVGDYYKKICRRLRTLGEKCKPKKLILCEDGLVCRGRKCRKPVVPVGGDCLPKGSVCARGSVCIGTPHKKICVEPSKLGGKCGTPFLFCKGKLKCLFGECVKPRRKLGERCSGAVRCKGNLDCKYLEFLGKAICVRVVGKGERCGSPVVCKKNLKCVHGTCISPKYYYKW